MDIEPYNKEALFRRQQHPPVVYGFHIWKEHPGVISAKPAWVLTYPGYMHTANNLIALLWSVITEFKHDRHMVG